MAHYLARILRAIVVSVLGLGGGVGLMTFIVLSLYSNQHKAIEVGLRTAVIVGLSFGSIMALVMLLSDLTMRLFVSQGRYAEIWELKQTRELEIEGTLKEIKRRCREALLTVPNLKFVSESAEEPLMSAAIGGSWRSPGEVVQVSIVPMSENHFRVTCISHCLQESVAFDYGKNFENVETWLRKMEQSAPAS